MLSGVTVSALSALPRVCVGRIAHVRLRTPTRSAFAELTPESFHSYEFHQVWGGSPEDSVTKMEDFFGSEHFQSLPPVAEAAATLRSLSAFFRFVVITARQHIIADRTRAWLDQHFPSLFEDVLFGNAYGTTGHKRWVLQARWAPGCGACGLCRCSLPRRALHSLRGLAPCVRAVQEQG